MKSRSFSFPSLRASILSPFSSLRGSTSLSRHFEPAPFPFLSLRAPEGCVAISLLCPPTVLSLRGSFCEPKQSRFCTPNTPWAPEIATSEQKTLLLAMTNGGSGFLTMTVSGLLVKVHNYECLSSFCHCEVCESGLRASLRDAIYNLIL